MPKPITCQRCDGTGYVMAEEWREFWDRVQRAGIPMEEALRDTPPPPEEVPCDACGGTGKVVYQPPVQVRHLALSYEVVDSAGVVLCHVIHYDIARAIADLLNESSNIINANAVRRAEAEWEEVGHD